MPSTIPKIISVDDHVVEPPHLFETWLPAKYPTTAAPRVERRGIGEHGVQGRHHLRDRRATTTRPRPTAGSTRTSSSPHKRHVAAVGLRPRRDDAVADHLRRDAAGLLRPEGPPRGHGRQLGRGVAVLPDLPALLRPDVRRGQGQGARARLRAGLQRLDGRGVVRRLRRPPDPAVHHPAVGRRARRRRGRAQRRPRRARRVLQRDPGQARPAVDPLRLLGPVLRRLRGDRHRRQHAHRLVVADAGDVARRAAGGAGHAQLRQRDGVAERLPLLRRARALPRPASSPTARARSAGSRTSSSGPTTSGTSTGPGAASQDVVPEPPSTYYYRQIYGCFFRDRHGLEVARTASASTTSRSRPTTRTPTRRGPTPRRSPRS